MNHPLITMTAITGKPSKGEIYEYLKSMKENGILSVLLYPRSGCEIEYLSEEWFSCIGNFIDCAKELNMHIWLYDDFNWPSGDAGGKVTKIPEFRLKSICTQGTDLGKISCKSRHNSGLFGEKYFPNLLSSECVDYFIECTHEEYFIRFKEYFGNVIKGIFTDEPSIGYCCQNGCIPYYDEIKDDYFKAYNRDFYSDMCENNDDFYINATKIISKKFKECYFDKLSSWCKNHGILMTGHLMCDDSPFYATKHGGNYLENLSTFSLPGIDDIFTDFANEEKTSLLGSIEYASNENGAMAELFALGPVDMSYAKKRAMIYLCSAFKINHYFLAISHFDMRGNLFVKDFFNNFSIDQPDFSAMKILAKEANIACGLAKKDFTPQVYIRYPSEYSAKRISQDYGMREYFNVINQLTYSQIQWKYINDEKVNGDIIEVDKEGKIILNGEKFDIAKIKQDKVVTDKNGDTPYGIFVRKYNDGSVLIINLFAKEQEYFIYGKKIYLEKYGVYLYNDDVKDKDKILDTVCSVTPIFDIRHRNENIIRTMHINSQRKSEVYCECGIDVTFAVRNETSAWLNGEKIITGEINDTLPRGMKNLYSCSKSYRLKKGVNIIETDNDIKYMPSVLIIGDFECKTENGDICKVYLDKRKNGCTCGDKIKDFGIIEFLSQIEIPKNATKIKIVGTDLLTEVYINGLLIDTKAFSPYEFIFGKEYQNKKVNLKIVQYSSIAPIFGNVDYWDKNVTDCGWRGTPSPVNSGFGFDKIEFI